MRTATAGNGVVIGGGIAGLLTAAALAPGREVTVLDRDPLDAGPRRGTPQRRHVHVLLPSGRQALEELLPGIGAELSAAGARTSTIGRQWFVFAGRRLRLPDADIAALEASRDLLERTIRTRVSALPGVRVRGEAAVRGLRVGGGRVVGVDLDGDGLDAELVIDASGRSSRLPEWLEAAGGPTVPVERIGVDLGYASRRYELAAGVFGGAQEVIIGGTPDQPRGAVLQHLEDHSWLVTLSGMLGDLPPIEHEAWLAFAATTAEPSLPEVLAAGRPLGDPVRHRIPEARWRHFERVDLPDGLLVMGDALVALNPVYGQGMSVAAMQAVALRDALRAGQPVDRRLQRRMARVAAPAWEISSGGDLAHPGVVGERTPKTRILGRYVARVQAAASVDEVVAMRFLQVIALLVPPPSLLDPRILIRTLRARPAALLRPAAPTDDHGRAGAHDADAIVAGERGWSGQAWS